MPVRLRLRDAARKFESHRREGNRNALHSDWCLTISPSQVGGNWELQIESRWQRCGVLDPSFAEAAVEDLDGLLRRLTAAAAQGPGGHRR